MIKKTLVITAALIGTLGLAACQNSMDREVRAWVKIEGFKHTVSMRDAIATCNPGNIHVGQNGWTAMTPCMEEKGYKQGWVKKKNVTRFQ